MSVMEANSSYLLYLITGLPLAGLALMALFLFSLSSKKDRGIIPATVLIFLALAGWGAVLEYGHLINDRAEKTQEALQVSKTPQPTFKNSDTDEKAFEKQKDSPASAKTVKDRNDSGRLIPAPDRQRSYTRNKDLKTSDSSTRRIIRTRPAPTTGRNENSTTTGREEPRPEPETRRTRPSPSREDSTPARTPASRERRTTRTRPETSSRSGSANLRIRIKGPILETAKEPQSSAHINIIVDGDHVRTVRPTRTKQDKNQGGEIMAITYFWENVSVSFNDLEPGWHVVQIDTSLENPRSHRSHMLSSSGQANNDYNGQIKLPAGQTSTMQFSTKNWNTGQLIRTR